MSDIMLLAVLNMSPELWTNDPIDVIQRHGRYKQAALEIMKLKEALHAIIDVHIESHEDAFEMKRIAVEALFDE